MVSVALHGGAVWLLLARGSAGPDAAAPPIEVELITRPEVVRGEVSAAEGGAPPPAPEPPAGEGALPPPPPPRPPQPQAAPGSRASVNLGGDSAEQEALVVTGEHVVPPRADSRFRNQPPAFPSDAARRGSQGIVRLRIHVSEAGVPGGIDVLRTAGDASLDRAALQAVALWRFEPARNKGVPVPFDFDIDIAFRR